MENPWTNRPSSASDYVLPEDRPYVVAWNRGQGEHLRLHPEVMPEPFVGSRDAPLVVLQRNPALGKVPNAHPPNLDAAVRGNLGDDDILHVGGDPSSV